jgi:hypothetical protein
MTAVAVDVALWATRDASHSEAATNIREIRDLMFFPCSQKIRIDTFRGEWAASPPR